MQGKQGPNSKKIRCIETGVIYTSTCEAAAKTGLGRTGIKMPLLAIRERVKDFTGNTSSKSDSRTKPCYTKSGEGLCDDPLSTKAPIRELF